MARVDLYGTVHKALRTRLFDTSVELARVDFGAPAEVGVALAAYRRTTGLLRQHHAMNLDERAAMVGGIKMGAPPQAFRAAADVAMRVLGRSAWSAVCTRAQIESPS